MITFVGAGPGAEDLITVRGQNKLKEADVVIYAGSLVNPALLKMCREECEIYNSAEMTLEEVMEVMIKGERSGKKVVRLHTGDPCLYGAIKEQMDELDRRKIPFEDCPGVSSFCGAAAALKAEYTLPGISQSVVITRMAGRTPVPEKESIRSFAAHQATMVLFLSTGMLEELSRRLVAGGYQNCMIRHLRRNSGKEKKYEYSLCGWSWTGSRRTDDGQSGEDTGGVSCDPWIYGIY